jgi:hypothetical protein
MIAAGAGEKRTPYNEKSQEKGSPFQISLPKLANGRGLQVFTPGLGRPSMSNLMGKAKAHLPPL